MPCVQDIEQKDRSHLCIPLLKAAVFPEIFLLHLQQTELYNPDTRKAILIQDFGFSGRDFFSFLIKHLGINFHSAGIHHRNDIIIFTIEIWLSHCIKRVNSYQRNIQTKTKPLAEAAPIRKPV